MPPDSHLGAGRAGRGEPGKSSADVPPARSGQPAVAAGERLGCRGAGRPASGYGYRAGRGPSQAVRPGVPPQVPPPAARVGGGRRGDRAGGCGRLPGGDRPPAAGRVVRRSGTGAERHRADLGATPGRTAAAGRPERTDRGHGGDRRPAAIRRTHRTCHRCRARATGPCGPARDVERGGGDGRAEGDGTGPRCPGGAFRARRADSPGDSSPHGAPATNRPPREEPGAGRAGRPVADHGGAAGETRSRVGPVAAAGARGAGVCRRGAGRLAHLSTGPPPGRAVAGAAGRRLPLSPGGAG